jgi:hypothetical protein
MGAVSGSGWCSDVLGIAALGVAIKALCQRCYVNGIAITRCGRLGRRGRRGIPQRAPTRRNGPTSWEHSEHAKPLLLGSLMGCLRRKCGVAMGSVGAAGRWGL